MTPPSEKAELSPSAGALAEIGEDTNAPGHLVPFRSRLEFPLSYQPNATVCAQECRRVVAVEKTRMLLCQTCGRSIEPFDYLAHWAVQGDNRLRELRNLDADIRLRRAELERVLTDLRSARRRHNRVVG